MIAAGLVLLGVFTLAAAMPRHAPALLGGWATRLRPQSLRIAGWALLAAALAVTLATPDWPRALVAWFGWPTLAAALMLLGLSYDVRLARGAAAMGVLGIAASVVVLLPGL
ncbi:DUF3325 family protein [Sphingomonas azotifigens]|uniref:DUF3325 family protein n=1 Tax=Sphingomonas azotifigens TaxID=330920 RepID=UPI0009FC0E41|nr:DUF3325 family protein [Sphingomonas azotifigens]